MDVLYKCIYKVFLLIININILWYILQIQISNDQRTSELELSSFVLLKELYTNTW